MANVVSRTIQSYLRVLAAQMLHYATLRLADGHIARVQGRLCLDAQVPAILGTDEALSQCALMARVSYLKDGTYYLKVLAYECQYDAVEVINRGPSHWNQLADLVAYQVVSQLVQWKKNKQEVTFLILEQTTSLKPDRQRFYL